MSKVNLANYFWPFGYCMQLQRTPYGDKFRQDDGLSPELLAGYRFIVI